MLVTVKNKHPSHVITNCYFKEIKMSTLKRIVSFFISISIILSFTLGIQAYSLSISSDDALSAYVEHNFGFMLNYVVSSVEKYGLEDADFSSFELLAPVTINNETQYDQSCDVWHFPVADANGKIVLIYDVFCNNNVYSASIGKSFAKLIDISRNENNLVVLFRNNGVLFATDGQRVYEYHFGEVNCVDNIDVELETDVITVSAVTENHEWQRVAQTSYVDYSKQIESLGAREIAEKKIFRVTRM